jgi:hypothetical protein
MANAPKYNVRRAESLLNHNGFDTIALAFDLSCLLAIPSKHHPGGRCRSISL